MHAKHLPSLIRDAALVSLIAAILFSPIVGLVLDGDEVTDHLGRVLVLVLIVFVGRLAVGTLAHSRVGDRIETALAPAKQNWKKQAQHLLQTQRLPWVLAALCVVLFAVPAMPFANNYILQVLSLTLIYVLLGMGLNIVVGLAGLLDLGYVAFYAAGAYGYALLSQYLGLGFWVCIPLTALLAAATGCILGFPVLRMHGDYLAIVTLGFGEIIRLLLTNLVSITGGPNGIAAPRPTLFGLAFTRRAPEGQTPIHEFLGVAYSPSYRYIFMYLIILLAVIAAIWFFKRLREMPIGRAWEALREDEIACKAMGINHVNTKLSAFTLGATFGGVAGVFFAAMEGFLNPSSFTFIESAIILVIVVLGGMGSILGVVIAAVCITLLPEVFREFGQFRMLIFGLAMVSVMLWRPKGLLLVRRPQFLRGGTPRTRTPQETAPAP